MNDTEEHSLRSALASIADTLGLKIGSTPQEIVRATENRWASGIHSCNNECQRPNCILRRQHAAYKQALEKVASDPGSEYPNESWNWAIRHIAKHALNTK